MLACLCVTGRLLKISQTGASHFDWIHASTNLRHGHHVHHHDLEGDMLLFDPDNMTGGTFIERLAAEDAHILARKPMVDGKVGLGSVGGC